LKIHSETRISTMALGCLAKGLSLSLLHLSVLQSWPINPQCGGNVQYLWTARRYEDGVIVGGSWTQPLSSSLPENQRIFWRVKNVILFKELAYFFAIEWCAICLFSRTLLCCLVAIGWGSKAQKICQIRRGRCRG
jgi:hypothetical protein